MFRRSKLSFMSSKDEYIKIFNERINLTEKHLNEMCNSFASYTRKLAKHRDAYDELAESVNHYIQDEGLNFTLGVGMKNFSNALTILGDYMDLNVHRMEIKVLNELSQFENLCKSTRENLKTAVTARDKEVFKQQQMLELKSKFNGTNAAADSELLKAKFEVNRTNKEIDEIMNKFEKHKLTNLKLVLCDFILLSMKYHAKSLEALSAAYYDVTNIDEEDDYRVFQNLVKAKNDAGISKLKMTARSKSMENLERDKLLNPLISRGKSKLSQSTKNLSESFESDERQDVNNSGEDERRKTNEYDEEDIDEEDDSEDSYTYDNESDSSSDKQIKMDSLEQFSPVGSRKLQYSKPGIKHTFKASPSNSWNKVFKPIKPISASRDSNSGLVSKRAGIVHHKTHTTYNGKKDLLFKAKNFKAESSSGVNTETTSLTGVESLLIKVEGNEH